MFRLVLCPIVLMSLCVGCEAKTANQAKEATITKVDANKGTVTVKMQSDGKEIDKTFKLADNIEYADSTGKVANIDIFTAGDTALIVESNGTITKMKKKNRTEIAKKSEAKDKTEKETKVADVDFIQTADQIDLAETKLGKLAEADAASEAVKKFGADNMRDHSLMNQELRKITTKQGVVLSEKLDPSIKSCLTNCPN